jgi:hypothetical protein
MSSGQAERRWSALQRNILEANGEPMFIEPDKGDAL